MIRSDIEELVNNWVHWTLSRRFYAPPIPKNMLVMMQKDGRPSREPPNAPNDALCAAFNMVIAIAEKEERLPFLYVYLKPYRPSPIKTLADELGITRETLYQKAHQAAERFHNRALRLMQDQAEIVNIKDLKDPEYDYRSVR